MNIPPKYEDVVAKLDAALGREAALLEELESIKASVDGYDSPEHAAQVADTLGHANTALQQRLTGAEQRSSELESAAREMLRMAGIANQGSNAYNRAIINLHSALNPATGKVGLGSGKPVPPSKPVAPFDPDTVVCRRYTLEQSPGQNFYHYDLEPVYGSVPVTVSELITMVESAPVAVVMPEDWEDQLFAEMSRRFDLRKQIDDDHMVYDDTQIGVEFARDWIKARLNDVKP